MTNEELKHIQTICRDWLTQPDTSIESRLTILPGGPLLQTVEVKLKSIMTPDNTTISSAVDVATGASYAGLVRQPGRPDTFIEMPFEKLAKPMSERLLPPGDSPPPEWNFEQYRGAREPEPDPVSEDFPLISVGESSIRAGWLGSGGERLRSG